jgi:benzoyl-CoA reductase/2-hydroxyglutaryl-CoA dehydratase subunit BcrC/BadD/HgdB
MKDASGGNERQPRFMNKEIAEGAAAHRDRIREAAAGQVQKHLAAMKALARPNAMEYFDLMADPFGKRAEELQKFKSGGGKVVGSLCYFAPAEIPAAFGAVPVRFCSGIYEAVHPANDLLGDAGLCPLVKSTLGLKMSGASPILELCDLVIVPTPCDAKLKLGEILQDMVDVHLMNMPAVKTTEAGRESWIGEIKALVRKLEGKFGQKLRPQMLKRSIQTYQRAQAAWRRFSQLRKNGAIWGRDALLVAQLTFSDDIERWTHNVERLCDELEGRQPVAPEAARVLLGGSPIIWPNWKVPLLIEESGGIIIADELCSGSRTMYDPVVVEEWTMEGMLVALAERYIMPCTCPSFSPNLEREQNMLGRIREFGAEGVVFHVLRGCHLNSLDATKADRVLRRQHIPMLKVESEYDEGDLEQVRTRVEAFIEMIKARRESSG